MKIKANLMPFLVALAIFAAAFVALDTAIMSMQGLSLIFQK